MHYSLFGFGGQRCSGQPITFFMYLENHHCQQPIIIIILEYAAVFMLVHPLEPFLHVAK